MRHRLGSFLLATLAGACAWLVVPVYAQRTNTSPVSVADLRAWLAVVASDAAQGREVFTEGAAIASTYIADELRRAGVEPAGEGGTYFQTVTVNGARNTGTSTVTVTVRGQSRTFRDGQGVRFPRYQGGKRVVSGQAEFVGYGLEFAPRNQHDYQGRDVRGRIVLYLGRGPASFSEREAPVLNGRATEAIDGRGAVAVIGATSAQGATQNQNPEQGGAGNGRGGSRASRPDFQTAQRLDAPLSPRIIADDEFFEFVFGAASYDYQDIKARANRREALPRVSLGDVRISIDIQAEYEVVQTRLSRNIVARVRGSDPDLRDTYLLYGAHYDHVGIAETPNPFLPRIDMCPGLARNTPRTGDIIFNGADDDGSGTVVLMALAKAFTAGPAPRRSVLFVWHTGEEAGLFGSEYMADFPTVPLERVAAQLNIDMVGRNKCDDPAEANTLYLVGSDRISSELHQLNEQSNASLPRPFTLDYTLNDPVDAENLYTRSDHYSYAAKGVPIIFFTTGLHSDYHALTDEADKIEYDKMARVGQLIYETGRRVADLDHLPVRDRRGPRAITRAATAR